ncbi:MASE1 domain-containing protein [Actinomadura barringtoniae]|uniref:Circadian input-output histidine kinase CikA n=1 Tax=Actinomadura barringtoniae TaxID=1427535 RepID=A0A939PRJ1_9ACTN|nr:MASE1 domain-containing protein [Actinomadura barringtoniae]MBO2453451.1 MASE1 domain-containing protein [Actinomadura barringtoniae]
MVRSAAYLGQVLLLAACYVLAGKAAFGAASMNTSVAPLWFPVGLAVAAVLLAGYRMLPGVFAGALVFNALTSVPFTVALAIAVGNTLEAAAALFLLRLLGFDRRAFRTWDLLVLTGAGALAATMVSATVGIVALRSAEIVDSAHAGSAWTLWWFGDAAGVLTVTPLVLLLWPDHETRPGVRSRLTTGRWVEAGALATTLAVVLWSATHVEAIRTAVVFPVAVWAAIRFRLAGAALVNAVCAVVLVWVTARGLGSLVLPSLSSGLLQAEQYVVVVAATSLLLAALTVERERATAALRRSAADLERERTQLRGAQHMAGLGSWEYDIESGMVSCSAELRETLGLPRASTAVTFADFLDLIDPADRPRFLDATAECADGGSFKVDLRVHSDGEGRVLNTQGVVQRNQDGELVRVRGIGLDVTVRKAIEDELAAARDQAVEASRLKSAFLATMSHEIRTPLNGVIGLAHALLAGPLDTEQRRRADGIRDAGESLLAISNDILDLSKIEAGALVLDDRAFDPVATVQEAVALFEAAAADKGLTLQVRAWRSESGWVRGDRTRVRQVVLNLVSNAVKFTSEGEIIVAVGLTEPPEDPARTSIRIEVRDTGEGIPPDVQARLFEPFVQADASTTRRHGGTGLGLAISRRLATAMGGDLTAFSAPGEGTTFRFTLALPHAPPPAVATPDRAAGDRPAAGAARARILLVEDNALNQMVAREVLTSLGYRFDVASDGVQAVELTRTRRYQAILMDCQMPVMDGYTATRAIRRRDRDHTPIIALSASVFAEDRQRCLAAGMDDFIAKPFDLNELAATLARWTADPVS